MSVPRHLVATILLVLSCAGLIEGFQDQILRFRSSLLHLHGSWGLSGLDSLKVSQSSTSKVQHRKDEIKLTQEQFLSLLAKTLLVCLHALYGNSLYPFLSASLVRF